MWLHLGTGAINTLVFALLTRIADLKGRESVIFAMEEPEIALPPHSQRRMTRFVIKEMGQAIAYFDKICGHIKRMYAERGEMLSEQEVLVAARNWLGFCKKIIEIENNDKNF